MKFEEATRLVLAYMATVEEGPIRPSRCWVKTGLTEKTAKKVLATLVVAGRITPNATYPDCFDLVDDKK